MSPTGFFFHNGNNSEKSWLVKLIIWYHITRVDFWSARLQEIRNPLKFLDNTRRKGWDFVTWSFFFMQFLNVPTYFATLHWEITIFGIYTGSDFFRANEKYVESLYLCKEDFHLPESETNPLIRSFLRKSTSSVCSTEIDSLLKLYCPDKFQKKDIKLRVSSSWHIMRKKARMYLYFRLLKGDIFNIIVQIINRITSSWFLYHRNLCPNRQFLLCGYFSSLSRAISFNPASFHFNVLADVIAQNCKCTFILKKWNICNQPMHHFS